MTLRVASFQNLEQFLRYNEASGAEQASVLERLSTLKKVNRASDEPDHYRRIKDAHTDISEQGAFLDNIESLQSRFRIVEDSLASIRDSIDRVRELAIQGSSFIYDDSERETMADEIEQIRLSVMNQLNNTHEGEYLFSGTLNTTQPFQDPVTGAYSGNLETIEVRISRTDTITANFTGEEIAFGATGQGGAEDILDVMDDLVVAFRANSTAAISAEIPRLRPAAERVGQLVSEVGTRSLRLISEETRYAEFEENLRATLSKLEDADLAEEAVNLEKVNATIDAQLRSSGSIGRRSLFDFLG